MTNTIWEEPTGEQPILAATKWRSNAELIETIVKLGYIRPDDNLLDLTYGRGTWWNNYKHPGPFTKNALLPDDEIVDGTTQHDYTLLPDEWASTYDVVAFDPPYIAMGGRTKTSLPDFVNRYGLMDAPRTPADLNDYNTLGLGEAAYVCKPNGLILVKCCDYISSGQLQLASHWMLQSALEMGLQVQDKLIHIGNVRPQPAGRRIVHARQNCSYLWVFRKPNHYSTGRRNGR